MTRVRSSVICLRSLNSINKCFLNAIENDHTDEHHDQHEACAVRQPGPGGVSRAQEASPEGFDDGVTGLTSATQRQRSGMEETG
jgi:hypothetical protein